MRLFFAVWPSPEAAAALHDWASELDGKPTRPENIHLTLAFLGEADPAKAAAAARRVRGRRHVLPLDAARYVKRNEMVWVAPRDLPFEMAELVERLHGNLATAGFVLEKRPFAAHVTLLRRAPMPKAIPPLPRVAWPVDEFLLVRSRTSPKGSSYEPVERFPLSE